MADPSVRDRILRLWAGWKNNPWRPEFLIVYAILLDPIRRIFDDLISRGGVEGFSMRDILIEWYLFYDGVLGTGFGVAGVTILAVWLFFRGTSRNIAIVDKRREEVVDDIASKITSDLKKDVALFSAAVTRNEGRLTALFDYLQYERKVKQCEAFSAKLREAQQAVSSAIDADVGTGKSHHLKRTTEQKSKWLDELTKRAGSYLSSNFEVKVGAITDHDLRRASAQVRVDAISDVDTATRYREFNARVSLIYGKINEYQTTLRAEAREGEQVLFGGEIEFDLLEDRDD